MKKIKCLVDLGNKGKQKRFIELNDRGDIETLRAELDGILGYMPEFRTTQGEIVCGIQIIQLAH